VGRSMVTEVFAGPIRPQPRPRFPGDPGTRGSRRDITGLVAAPGQGGVSDLTLDLPRRAPAYCCRDWGCPSWLLSEGTGMTGGGPLVGPFPAGAVAVEVATGTWGGRARIRRAGVSVNPWRVGPGPQRAGVLRGRATAVGREHGGSIC